MNAIDRMSEIIGLSPVKDKIPFVCIETVDCGAYVRNRIEYKVNGRIIYAFLLIPEGEGTFPAVLVNHQHNRELNLGKVRFVVLKGILCRLLDLRLQKKDLLLFVRMQYALRTEEQTGKEQLKTRNRMTGITFWLCAMAFYQVKPWLK